MAKTPKAPAIVTVWAVRVIDRSGAAVPPTLYPVADDHLLAQAIATNYAVCALGAPPSTLFTTVVTGRVIDLATLVSRQTIKPLSELKLPPPQMACVVAAVEVALGWRSAADEWQLSPKVVAVMLPSEGDQRIDIRTLSLLELVDLYSEAVVIAETIAAL